MCVYVIELEEGKRGGSETERENGEWLFVFAIDAYPSIWIACYVYAHAYVRYKTQN